jgi:iron complex outermembrane receptor protein
VEYSSDGYWDGGIRFAYVLPGAKTEIGVYGRNITDQVKLVGGIDFDNLTGFINPPRLWGVDVKYRF